MKDKLETQQPKGELISANDTYAATEGVLTAQFTPQIWIAVGAKAQLAHCQKTMVKIDWLFEPCPHSTDPLFLATRHECDECMEELTRQRSE